MASTSPTHPTATAKMRFADEDGIAATMVVIVFATFMFGLAALAIDLSAGYEEARAQQTVVDLACMAAVDRLPEDPATAVLRAAQNVTANIAAFRSADPSSASSGNDWMSLDGEWTVRIETPLSGDASRMRVTASRSIDTTFARAIGFDELPVSQRATCAVFSPATGDLPMGVLPGDGFDGVIKAETCGNQGGGNEGGGNQGGGNQGGGNQGGGNQGGGNQGGGGPNDPGNQTGNCQYLDVPRVDGRMRNLEANISFGVDREMTAWNGSSSHCGSSNPCNTASTETGSVVAQLTTGLAGGPPGNVPGRLTSYLGPFPTQVGNNLGPINGDTWERATDPASPAYVLKLSGETMTRTWEGYPGALELPVVETIGNCSHPRLARVPVVVRESDLAADWPPGQSGDMRILGFYDIWIDDVSGSGNNLSVATGVAFDASGAMCVGPDGDVVPFQPGGIKLARLVAN
jgi:uncharacterized membrane protein YgcG